ncbi:MAG: IS110 family transposase [Kiritimatiellaeota bacterium]|nr:IS110 family transposase [Kiritimatiellota bacterium]
MNINANTLAAYVGLDWADRVHAVCLQAAASTTAERSVLPQQPEALAAWALALQERFGGRPVGVCLEQSRGPVVYALSAYPWLVLYPVNPKSLAAFRLALRPSRSKDDSTDAALLCELLRLHGAQLHPWQAEDAATRMLRGLLEQRDKLVDDRTRLSHRLRAALKLVFPQALDWAGPLTQPVSWDFLRRWPSLADLQQATAAELQQFCTAHHIRRGTRYAALYAAAQAARPLVTDVAVVQPTVLLIGTLCRQLPDLHAGIGAHDQRIAELFAQHPEHALFAGLPGAGPVLAPRLLVAFGSDRARYPDAGTLQQLSGIAPVTERSGRACWIHWRWAAALFLRQTFHEYALHSQARSAWARAYYRLQRQRGKSHQAAVRALAFKWIRVLFRCWQSRTPYDETRYLAALCRHQTPLLQLLPQPKEAA